MICVWWGESAVISPDTWACLLAVTVSRVLCAETRPAEPLPAREGRGVCPLAALRSINPTLTPKASTTPKNTALVCLFGLHRSLAPRLGQTRPLYNSQHTHYHIPRCRHAFEQTTAPALQTTAAAYPTSSPFLQVCAFPECTLPQGSFNRHHAVTRTLRRCCSCQNHPGCD